MVRAGAEALARALGIASLAAPPERRVHADPNREHHYADYRAEPEVALQSNFVYSLPESPQRPACRHESKWNLQPFKAAANRRRQHAHCEDAQERQQVGCGGITSDVIGRDSASGLRSRFHYRKPRHTTSTD